MIFLVRTVLRENGKLTSSEIRKKIENSFKAYKDCEHLYLDTYPIDTFEKDKRAIRDAWKIDLVCNKRKYTIDIDLESVFQNDLLNSAIFLSSLNTDMLLPRFVLPETRKNTGLEHFHSISQAIEKHLEVNISYFDYSTEKIKIKTIQPYLLKQKDFKWYVLAVDNSTPEIQFKSYALERIGEITTGKKFKSQVIDFQTPYRDALGMFTNGEAERIILQYDHRDGHYLKANPLHNSQKVVSEDDKTITFEFFVKPNEDLLMELMKRSWSVKIIEPTSLKCKMISLWKDALNRNLS
ncbi:WYL domain-containing protein [Riemerella anatipestifer]|nr:WYL domain-containing protein [Riemerella anatipestifer]